ncbi:hypothetical protein KKC13_04015 [bacterium]|nr:hypothetical protein [bacterium]MBU1959279.1 hypothetical protein [bacterium]
MKLSEIIEQEGSIKVSTKTNISEQNLNALANENFSKLNRVKALGFLVILEREYPEIEVEDIREKVKEHFEEDITIDENMVVLSREKPVKGGFPLFKWFIILVLLSGGWYLYNEGELDGLLNNIQDKEEFFDDGKALESNISTEDAQKIVIENSEEMSVKIDTVEEPKVEKSIVLRAQESNESNGTTQEVQVPVNTIQSVVATVATKENANKKDVNTTLVDSSAQEVASESSLDNNTTASEITTITINPTRGMLWFGFIDLDTKQRKEFMKKVSTPFDIKGGRFLLVTGHGYVDIVSEIKTVEVADRNKHFFYVDSTEIRELTQQEFRDMNGKRGW